MGKLMSLLGACVFTLLFVPVQVLAAGAAEGAEEAAHAEPSGLLLTALAIMSFATLISMIYFSFRDNG